jgi:hypothetical protein
MAKLIIHPKGFKIVKFSQEEGNKLNWGTPQGFICMQCNNYIEGDLYYIAALHDVMDENCCNNYLKKANYYAEDAEYEDNIIENLKKLIDIEE